MYGHDELTKDGEGYIYWKGIHVEHYSFHDDNAESLAAGELVNRCRKLEALGVPVTIGTAIWFSSWYDGFETREDIDRLPALLRALILKPRDIYENARGGFAWIAQTHTADGDTWPTSATVCIHERGGMQSTFLLQADDYGGFYHPLRALGWTTAQMGQRKDNGCCYATGEQVLGFFLHKLYV